MAKINFTPSDEVPVLLSEEEKERRRKIARENPYYMRRGRYRKRTDELKRGGIRCIDTPELVKRTAITSGYTEIEVKDIIRHFIAHIQQALIEPVGAVKIQGVGTIERVVYKPREFISYTIGKKCYVFTAPNIKIRADKRLRNILKDVDLGENLRYADTMERPDNERFDRKYFDLLVYDLAKAVSEIEKEMQKEQEERDKIYGKQDYEEQVKEILAQEGRLYD